MMGKAKVAKQVSSGLLGLGTTALEAKAMSGGETHKTFLDEMKDQGIINSRSFSMWLNTLDSDEGNLLFGGYDTEKYYDELYMLDIQPSPEDRYLVALANIQLSHGELDYSFDIEPFAVNLDSGCEMTYLPSDTFDALASYFNVTLFEGSYIVPCSLQEQNGSLWFQFGATDGNWVQVPLSELALPLFHSNLTYSADDSPACGFGLYPNNMSQGMNFFGATFLRSAYVLYDLENMQIGIANAKWNITESNILEVSANGDVASATSVEGVTLTQTALAGVMAIQAGVSRGNASNATKPTSAVTSLEGAVLTSITNAPSHGGGDHTSTPTSTESAASSSSSAAAAPAFLEQASFSLFLLPLAALAF